MKTKFLLLTSAAALACQTARAQVTPTFTNAHPQAVLQNLVGTYFNNIYLTNPVFSRAESTINYDWGTGSPDPRINADNFSVRWTGKIVAEYAGTYTIYATSDDGIRVWIDNQLIIDSWVAQAPTEHTNTVSLSAGVPHDLTVEYYEQTGGAVAQLSWSGGFVTKQILGTPINMGGTAGTGDGFGTTLVSLGGGNFAIGAPNFTSVNGSSPFVDGRGWLADSNGVDRILLSSPLGFYLFIEQGFGTSLGVTGNGTLLIGAPKYNTGNGITGWNTNVGAVYYGDSSGPTINPSGHTFTYFGTAVAGLPGNQYAVSSTEGGGRVYLYTGTGTGGPITVLNAGSGSGFGNTLAGLGANRILIAHPNDSVAGDNAGSVFIYDLAGNPVTKIHNPTGRNEGFGTALLGIDDHRFFIGAPNARVVYVSQQSGLATNSSAGLVYMYDDTATQLLVFTNADLSVSGGFGSSLALLGPGRVLIGSPGDKIGAYNGAGEVILCNLGALPLEIIKKAAPVANDHFGAAVCALDDRHFVVGSPNDDTAVTDGGAVYGFDAPIPSAELGAEIVRPSGSIAGPPTVSPPGAAFWHAGSQKLFAVQPGAVLVTWQLTGGLVYNWQANLTWPSDTSRYQVHVGGQTPVDMSGGGAYSNVVLEATTTDALSNTVAATRVFSAQNTGLSFFMLSNGDPTTNAIRFQLVRTINWSDPSYLYDNAPATIGQPIADPGGFHNPAAGSPQVVLPASVYCPAPVFDPATRTGTIIPVNKDNPANPADDLVVAFYQKGTLLWDPITSLTVSNNIFWPYKPVRYQPQWPTNAPAIVIASQQGTGVINPAQYVNWQLYFQNDPTHAGFNPNDEHALRMPYAGGEAVFALRNDLGTPQTSDPYVLIRYQDPASGGAWRMKVWSVVTEQSPWFFQYPAQAGVLLQPPFPMSALAPAPETHGVSGPYWRDRKGYYWAKAAGDNGSHADIVMQFFYPMQPSFFYPGSNPPPPGTDLPLLDLAAGTPGTPINIHFDTAWPANLPQLRVGETLVKPKFGLPDISSQTSAEIVYQQSVALGGGTSVKLIDPTREFHVPLAQLPSDLAFISQGGVDYFPALPPQLQSRFYYDPTTHWLKFKGQVVQPPAGEYYVLLNILTARETAVLLSLSTDSTYQNAVNALAAQCNAVTEVPSNALGFDSMALSAGAAQGQGYVTLAFGNNPNLSPPSEPISLAVIQVSCPNYQGEIKVIASQNPFDEKLTMRHSGDFAGNTDAYIFDWRTRPPVDGLPPTDPPELWNSFTPTPATGQGAVDLTIQGPGLFTLSDNYFVCRYRRATNAMCTSPTNQFGWSDWTSPMLAEGWVKRVTRGLNPFEQRVQSYNSTAVNTVVSMISQAGGPYRGPIALNQQNANSFGLIETYETVLRRGEDLSIDGAPAVNYGPANDALLLAAGRLADLYMLLGNEAYADAADPTIAFGTDDRVYGAEATSIHCFMNQTASLMEEEMDLLRGRDDSLLPGVRTAPVYNRLFWNFTSGIDGGEVAYALNYNIRAADGSVSGTISAADAQSLYPQGHGDAWGHYLSAIKNYYRLLRNPNFTWVPRPEAVTVGGVTVSVDYYDERKFAAAAAARARTGAEIVNLTYRSAYVEDPTGQWQGYSDSDTNRAWGVSEWGSRAGQGAYFDWVAGNALLPDADSDPTHTGIRKIDRTTVPELKTVAAALGDIQSKIDQADSGLNPLGLAKNVVPFDIDPAQVALGKTHFEQIYDRAVAALLNAVTVFNNANNSTQLLRRQADDLTQFQQTVSDRERDFKSRLIEIFGYPYGDDIGPTGAYPSGYDGPDVYHFDYVDTSQLVGQTPPPTQTFTLTLVDSTVGPDGAIVSTSNNVPFTISSQELGVIKPSTWTQPRRAPGQIQIARSDLLQGYARFQRALVDYNNLIAQIEDKAALLQQQYGVDASEISIMNQNLATQKRLNTDILEAHAAAYLLDRMAQAVRDHANEASEALPKLEGLASDVFAGVRAALMHVGSAGATVFSTAADLTRGTELVDQQDKEIASLQSQINITVLRDAASLSNDLSVLTVLVRQEASSRLELFSNQEALQQLIGRYDAALASGLRLVDDRTEFRKQTAAQIQQYRYKDMAFRLFRNDALQKYRAAFDLASMYVYLAARAYDYETCLQENDPRGPGSDFMTGIIRSRSLGLIENGVPQLGSGTGDPGLADSMARMSNDWNLNIKSQLGFNNPQTETGRFSLRSELLRIQPGSLGGRVWRDTLQRDIVDNLLTMPEFKRFCIPFQPQLPVEPAIVIPFSTSINFGQNFFGWPAGGGDNDYDSTHFVTKIRSVGVWFANYNNLNLINTPRVYLIPIGEDVMRSPSSNVGSIREWKIIDQKLPVPFPLTLTSISAASFIPMDDSLSDTLGGIRQYAEFRAYHDSGNFDPSQTITDTRLIGRSVWNTRWLLIIPGGNLLSDRNEGIQRFINGSLLPNGTRDGNGVTDIKIFFQTYAFAGTK